MFTDTQGIWNDTVTYLKSKWLNQLKWMEPLIRHPALFGYQNFQVTLKAVVETNDKPSVIYLINKNSSGSHTLCNRLCLDWAQSKCDVDIKLLCWVNIQTDDVQNLKDPVDLLINIGPENLLKAQREDIKKIIEKKASRICFLLNGLGNLDVTEQNQILQLFVQYIVIVNDGNYTEQREDINDTNKIFLPTFARDQQTIFIETYFSSDEAKWNLEYCKALHIRVGHQHIVPYLMTDPDNMLLLCFFLEKLKPTDTEDISGLSKTQIMERITFNILQYNDTDSLDVSSVEKLPSSILKHINIVEIDKTSSKMNKMHVFSNDTRNSSQGGPYHFISTDSGSFREIEAFVKALCVKDQVISRSGLSAEVAMYVCGVSGTIIAAETLTSMLKKTGVIDSQWMQCLQEAVSASDGNHFPTLMNYLKEFLSTNQVDINIQSKSTYGTTSLMLLCWTIFRDNADRINKEQMPYFADLLCYRINSYCQNQKKPKPLGNVERATLDKIKENESTVPNVLNILYMVHKLQPIMDEISLTYNKSGDTLQVIVKTCSSCNGIQLGTILAAISCISLELEVNNILILSTPTEPPTLEFAIPPKITCLYMRLTTAPDNASRSVVVAWKPDSDDQVRGLVLSDTNGTRRVMTGISNMKNLKMLCLIGSGLNESEKSNIKMCCNANDLIGLQVLFLCIQEGCELGTFDKEFCKYLLGGRLDIFAIITQNSKCIKRVVGNTSDKACIPYEVNIAKRTKTQLKEHNKKKQLHEIILETFYVESRQRYENGSKRHNRLSELIHSIAWNIHSMEQKEIIYMWTTKENIIENMRKKDGLHCINMLKC